MLSEARKYGLYLTLANQNLSQLNASQGYQNLTDAVLGNIGNMVVFRVGPADAEKLHAYTLPEFNTLDLQGLPNYHAIARLMTAQGPTRPFVFNTLPAIKPRGYAIADQTVWDARAQACSSSVAEVEAQILRRRTIQKIQRNRKSSTSLFKFSSGLIQISPLTSSSPKSFIPLFVDCLYLIEIGRKSGRLVPNHSQQTTIKTTIRKEKYDQTIHSTVHPACLATAVPTVSKTKPSTMRHKTPTAGQK